MCDTLLDQLRDLGFAVLACLLLRWPSILATAESRREASGWAQTGDTTLASDEPYVASVPEGDTSSIPGHG